MIHKDIAYFDMGAGELELEAEFHYDYYAGFAGSRYEPPEEAYIAITDMVIPGMSADLAAQFLEVMELDDIEIRIMESIQQDAEDWADSIAESKYEDMKERQHMEILE